MELKSVLFLELVDQSFLNLLYFTLVAFYGVEFVFFAFQCVNGEDAEVLRSCLTNV